MTKKKPTYEELEARLAEAEKIIDALKAGQVDAVVSQDHVMMLHLKEAEEALRKNEQRLKMALDASGGAIYDHYVPLDELTYHDERWVKILGYHPDELPPYDRFLDWFFAQVHPEDREPLERAYEVFIEGSTENFQAEVRLRHKQGHWVWVKGLSIASSRDENGRVRRVTGIMTDITERKQAEESLRRLNETLEQKVAERTIQVQLQRDQLRVFAARLTELREEERRRLSRELHDQVGQIVAALDFNLNFVRKQVSIAPAEVIDERLVGSLTLIEQISDKVRDLLAELRPPTMEEDGLVGSLEWYARQFGAKSELDIQIEDETEQHRLSPAAEICLFRIAQEALTNVSKHAGAAYVRISLERVGDQYRLVITDDGVGFDPNHQSNDQTASLRLGLLSMEERALSIGGRFRVESEPGRGVTIIVEAPVQ